MRCVAHTVVRFRPRDPRYCTGAIKTVPSPRGQQTCAIAIRVLTIRKAESTCASDRSESLNSFAAPALKRFPKSLHRALSVIASGAKQTRAAGHLRTEQTPGLLRSARKEPGDDVG